MQLERNVDFCNKTKTMVCLGHRTRTYLTKKLVTSKRRNMQSISALNYKLIFLEVRGLSPDIFTLVKKRAIRNTRLLLIYYQ